MDINRELKISLDSEVDFEEARIILRSYGEKVYNGNYNGYKNMYYSHDCWHFSGSSKCENTISFEDWKKSFISEYVELLPNWDSNYTGKIFKTSDNYIKYPLWPDVSSWKKLFERYPSHKSFFKPSTKEAYDKQQNKEESLIGRYVKALIDRPAGTNAVKDKYYKIVSEDGSSYVLDIPSGKYIWKDISLWKNTIELMPKDFDPDKKEDKIYRCLPFPENNFVKLKVIKDIVPKDIDSGSIPITIKAGSITWVYGSYTVNGKLDNRFTHIENNRYSSNIPSTYFEIISETSIKFEVGKWYRYNPDVYLKFNRMNDTNDFICSERIVGGRFSIVTSSYPSNGIKEISLEEIQKYLPDGHVDKIEKFIYKFKNGDKVFLYKHDNYSNSPSHTIPLNIELTVSDYTGDSIKVSYDDYFWIKIDCFKPISELINMSINNNFEIHKELSNYKFPKYEIDCYIEPKEGKLFSGRYNLNEFLGRDITDIRNGFIQVSGFMWGWFKISDIGGSSSLREQIRPEHIVEYKGYEFPEPELLIIESNNILDTKVNKIESIKTNLVEESKLLLF